MDELTKAIRPLLTLIGFLTLLSVLGYGLARELLSMDRVLDILVPIVTMMLGYWYGSRNLGTPETQSTPTNTH